MAYRDTNIATASRKVSAKAHRDLYQEITDKIIAQMEAGTLPWEKPWRASGKSVNVTMPANAATGRNYSGVNVLILWNAAQDNGYADNRWMTFKQAQAAGASVRKGEKGTAIVYADKFIPKGEAAKAQAENRDAQSVYFLKSFYVFNVAQIDGLPVSEPLAPMTDEDRHEAAETMMLKSGADIRHGGDRAYYSPAHDYVQMPHRAQFADHIDYYRTAAHELVHWTGHHTRLARKIENRFGDAQYAREELVAELGAAFLCATMGIEPSTRHASYLKSWIDVLKEDKRAIFRAASAASKAADLLAV